MRRWILLALAVLLLLAMNSVISTWLPGLSQSCASRAKSAILTPSRPSRSAQFGSEPPQLPVGDSH